MKVQFYPRDIKLFRTEDFDFSVRGNITLIARNKYDYKIFDSRLELIEFLKGYGISLEDPKYPLRIEELNEIHYSWGYGVSEVISHELLGWIKEW